jgi:hypothetical protein
MFSLIHQSRPMSIFYLVGQGRSSCPLGPAIEQ